MPKIDVTRVPFQVFDLDGTLLDSFPEVRRIFLDVVLEADPDLPLQTATDFFNANTHQRVRDLLPRLFAEHGHPKDEAAIAEMYDAFCVAFDASEASYFPHAIDTIRHLRHKGCSPFLSSLSPDHLVARRLAHLDVPRDLFQLALGSTRLRKGPLHIAEFARMYDCTPKTFAANAIMWGDTAYDMQMAKAAGMYAIGVSGTLTPEELVAAGADEVVPSVLAGLLVLP